MKPSELEKFLYDQIPLASALEISVLHADDGSAAVKAPLYPNRNHMGTAFGGSLNAVMVLAGYAWLFQCLETRGQSGHVVLKQSTIQYLLPVAADFTAIAKGPERADFEKFLNGLARKGRSRVHVVIEIDTPSGVACRLSCEFVARSGDHAEVDWS
jgi:thioesterase domain-containing protein